MNKEDIIQALSTQLFDRKQAKTAVEATLAIIKEALKKGDRWFYLTLALLKQKKPTP